MTSRLDDTLTHDAFLGGQLRIWQPREGYRAGTDAVLLAAATPVHAGQSVLELGCGVGVASLCLTRRAEGLGLTGVEIQPGYAELAARNARDNGVELEVSIADVLQLPDELRQRSFDHVIANPPYFVTKRLTPPKEADKETAYVADENTTEDWVVQGLKRLKPKGHLTFIQRVEQLPVLLHAISSGCGDISIIPIASRSGAPATRCIVRGRKGAKGPCRLNAPIIMHSGVKHGTDADSYSEAATSILRDGLPL